MAEWRAERMPVYCVETGSHISVEDINQLVKQTAQENSNESFAFIVYHDSLSISVEQKILTYNQDRELTIIPIHTSEIMEVFQQQNGVKKNLAYQKLVSLKKKWGQMGYFSFPVPKPSGRPIPVVKNIRQSFVGTF